MDLSIITTLYDSASYIEIFFSRISAVAKKITKHYEIIFVNDGSTDNSLDIAVSLQKKNSKIKVIDLSRNFGHHKAIMTGLGHATGDFIFLIDVDLEEDPELLTVFWEKMSNHKGHVDVYYGVQQRRKGGLFERISGAVFFKIFNFLSEVKIAENICVVRLMTKQFVENLMRFTESELVFVGICEIAGFNQKPIYISKKSKGSSSYDLSRKVGMAINFVVSFSSKPLVLIFYLGLVTSAVSLTYALIIFYRKLFQGIPVQGWSSLIISIWLVGGMLMFSIGTLGLYLSKIFLEVKNRPYTVIRKIYAHKEP